MDAFKAALEEEMRPYSQAPWHFRTMLREFRNACTDPLTPHMENPYHNFLNCIFPTDVAIALDATDAHKGGMALHLLALVDRLTFPEQFKHDLFLERRRLEDSIRARKAQEMINFVRQPGVTRQAIRDRKDEVGWRDQDFEHMKGLLRWEADKVIMDVEGPPF